MRSPQRSPPLSSRNTSLGRRLSPPFRDRGDPLLLHRRSASMGKRGGKTRRITRPEGVTNQTSRSYSKASLRNPAAGSRSIETAFLQLKTPGFEPLYRDYCVNIRLHKSRRLPTDAHHPKLALLRHPGTNVADEASLVHHVANLHCCRNRTLSLRAVITQGAKRARHDRHRGSPRSQ